MEGRKLVCKGDGEDTYAKFIFEKGGEYFAVVRCSLFEVEDDEIVGAPASFSIYFESDSIYHPGLQMRYNHRTHLLSLIRLNRGTAQSPFFNAFHNVNMYAEALYWVMNSEEISFEVIRGLSPESRAGFESDRYYSAYDYYRLQGIDDINPLLLVKRYSETYGTSVVSVIILSEFIRKPVEQAIAMLLLLESKGFVVYNSDKREAVIKPRLYDYLLAHTGDTDYDALRFDSHTWYDNNAEVELATFDMLIKGVPEIFLSDSQQVYIYPRDNRFVMKKNKDFTFSGRVRAGLFDFYAEDCSFEYANFRINLPRIDSMSFFVRVPDNRTSDWTGNKYVRVRAVVENMNGFILIDDPDNKAGLKKYPQYPIFTSIDNSFVYYDKVPGIAGIYNREDFYYELDPFTLDSLDNFSTKGLKFKGYLSTGGILPNLEDELVVQEDFSLGVNSFTDRNGLPLYGGLAQFYDTIRMDNSGLHGEGRMEYLTSVTESSDMMFYPDSVVSTTRNFKVNKLLSDVEYADVSAGVTHQHWYPDSNLMVIDMIREPFSMFDQTASLKGSLYLTPYNLTGEGDFIFERAVIESDDFIFGHHSMAAETSDFRLYTDTTFTDLAFLTYNYRTDLDFDQRTGKFVSSSGTSLVNMPFNQFICYMDEIYWEMDEETMKLQNNILEEFPEINMLSKAELIDYDLKGSDFISTRPDQDSLRFFSTRASYDLNTNVIFAEDVKLIRVADAAIFPGDGTLTIQKDANIETLRKAEIITDTATKYHSVYDASVDILSRHKYYGDGTIDYFNVFDEASPIFLDTIYVESGRSRAEGSLDSLSGFHLSPWYAFSGDVYLQAAQQFLRFKGGYAIEQDCYEPPLFMASMDTLVDPKNILIPVPDTIFSPEGDPLYASLMFSPDEGNFYPAFFSSRKDPGDIPVLNGAGYLQYEQEAETFRVSDTAMLPGKPYLSYHSRTCLLEGVGEIDLEASFPYITFDMYGNGLHYMIPDSTKFNVVLGLSFFFDADIMRRFTRSLNAANLPGALANTTIFNEFLRQRLQAGEADRLLTELANFGNVKRLPSSIQYTMLFNGIRLAWNPDASAMLSYGGISIFSIGEEIVNKVVPGYIEVERPRDGRGEFTMYFMLPDGEWYYFNYRNYILQTISSNEGYNNEILNLNFEKRITVDRDEKTSFEYVISSRRKVADFKRRLEEVYGIRVE